MFVFRVVGFYVIRSLLVAFLLAPLFPSFGVLFLPASASLSFADSFSASVDDWSLDSFSACERTPRQNAAATEDEAY